MESHQIDKIGPGVWYTLHLFSAHANSEKEIQSVHSLINLIRKNFFCVKCRDHFELNAGLNPPPKTNTDNELFAWTVMMHNKVNEVTGKSIVEVDEALEHYKGSSQFCTSGCGHSNNPEDKIFKTSDSKIDQSIKTSLTSNPKNYPKLKLGSI